MFSLEQHCHLEWLKLLQMLTMKIKGDILLRPVVLLASHICMIQVGLSLIFPCDGANCDQELVE